MTDINGSDGEYVSRSVYQAFLLKQGIVIKKENPLIIEVDVKPNEVHIELMHTMLSRWDSHPGLVISVHGGIKRTIPFDADEKQDFKESLLKVAKHSNTWIITVGQKTGITELVGDAAKDHQLLHNIRQYKLLGIATKQSVKEEDIDEYYDGCIMTYENGENDNCDVGSTFRTRFEDALSKNNYPIVMILIEGGIKAINTVALSIQKGIPLIVFNGSQRVADLLVDFLRNKSDNMEHGYKYYMPELVDFKDLEISLKMIQEKKHLIHIIDMKDINNELDRIIMKAAFSFKSFEYTALLDLQMSYNRYDLAREKISQFLTLNEFEQKLRFKRAWTENLFNFINLFTLYGIEMDKMLVADEKVLVVNKLIDNIKNDNEMLKLCDLKVTEDIQPKFKKLSNGIYMKNRSYFTCFGNQQDQCHENDTKEFQSTVGYFPRERFILCLILQRFEMARLLWKYDPNDDGLGLALTGCVICKSMSKLCIDQGKEELRGIFLQEKKFYLDLAVGLLTKAQETDIKKAKKLIIQEVEDSDVKTPMEIASKNGLMEFINHSVCQTRINRIWYGRICSHTNNWLLCISLLFFPLIFKLITFTDKKVIVAPINDPRRKNIQMLEDLQQRLVYNTDTSRISLNPYKKLKYFFEAPIIRCMMNCISYCIFLALLSYVCLVDLAPITKHRQTFRIPEFLVYLYVVALVIEEIRQICMSSDGSYLIRLLDWWDSSWNKFDAFIFFVLLIAVILRFTPSINFVYARTLFSCSLSFFYIRFLQFYMPVQMLGPKVIMITKMMRDIGFFILIYLVVLLAYGTYAQALLFPNTNFTWPLIRAVFYLPYWQTYGELSLEYVEGQDEVDGVKPQKNTSVVVAFALFMLCSNVLLLNLLIAMFGNTYAKIESVSREIWGYYRYSIVKEYFEKPILPPPFNVFETLWMLIRFMVCSNNKNSCYHKVAVKKKNKFFLSKQEALNSRLPQFLTLCSKTYLRQNPLLSNGMENTEYSSTDVADSDISL